MLAPVLVDKRSEKQSLSTLLSLYYREIENVSRDLKKNSGWIKKNSPCLL